MRLKVTKTLFSMILFFLGSVCLASTASQEKQILGLLEYVRIKELGVTLKAKLDTGATTSSLSAKNIQHFDRGGEPWVRFQLAYKNAPQHFHEMPLSRQSRIKRRADDPKHAEGKPYATRPVVLLTLQLAGQQQIVEVNLTDRSRFLYPFLLGSRGLRTLNIVVDPAQKFTAKQSEKINPNTSPK